MKRFLYKILLSVNALFAFALILSYLSVHISPEDFALPAIFGLAYPYLLLINIIMAVVWAVLLRPEALISVIVIAAGFTHFSNFIRFTSRADNMDGTFKVMSYNLRLLNYYERDKTNSEKSILTFLKEQQPDILFLQEFYVVGDPVQKDNGIKRALGGNYQSHIKLIRSGRNSQYGIITYSKFPIIKRGDIIHKESAGLSIFTDIVIKNDTFRIFNNHLQSFRLRSMERSFIEEMASYNDRETLNEVMSLSGSLKKAFIIRAKQSEVVREQISNSPYPVIVAGDFNDTPVSFSYRKIRGGLNDSFVSSGYGAGFTYRGKYPANRIDYILFDDYLESSYFEIFKVRYSDHYPVAAWLKKSN